MLAQWKSDRLITCKSLDRNEDMLEFFFMRAIASYVFGSWDSYAFAAHLTIILLQLIIGGIEIQFENDRS